MTAPRKPKAPKAPKKAKVQLKGALAANRAIYSVGMGVALDDIQAKWDHAIANPVAPRIVETAVCQEVVIEGAALQGEGHGLDALPIPPQAVVKLAPGGYHIMLRHPRRALAAGMSVKLELRFASGSRLTVAAPVRRAESGATHHH